MRVFNPGASLIKQAIARLAGIINALSDVYDDLRQPGFSGESVLDHGQGARNEQ